MQKKALGFVPAPQGHWVRDGFPVRSLFSYTGLGQHLSPFLLLDYAGPAQFEPATRPRGIPKVTLPAGDGICVQATQEATFLLLSGEPIAEPMVGYGPFVMNSRAEIEAAMADFNAGKFGRMPPLEAPLVDPSAGAEA